MCWETSIFCSYLNRVGFFSLVCLSVETKYVFNFSSELNNYYIIEVFELFYA